MLPERVWRPQDILMLATIVIVVTLYSYELWNDARDPARIPYMTAVDPIVEQGGVLRVEGTIIKERECPIEISRVYTSPRWGTVRDPNAYSAFAPIGTTDFVLNIDVPDSLRPGEWHYRSFGVYTCGGEQYSITSPDVPFTVIAPTQDRGGTGDEHQPFGIR